jgi:pulcherriminic acid synthase
MMAGFGGSDTAQQGLEARQHLEDFLEDIVRERRLRPTYLYDEAGNEVGPDIISTLCATKLDGDFLSTEEITSNIALLVGGGGETTRGAIMNMWCLLLQHPDQLEAIKADDSLWDAAFNETMRCGIPTGGQQPRQTTIDLELHGVRIPAGSLVHMVNHAANRDKTRFKDGDAFNILRDDLYTGKMLRSGYDTGGQCSHMSFGSGAHFCPGAWISHQEATVSAKVLLAHMKNPRIHTARMPKDIDGASVAPVGLNAIRELWVEFDRVD